jgi:hypothetical protein
MPTIRYVALRIEDQFMASRKVKFAKKKAATRYRYGMWTRSLQMWTPTHARSSQLSALFVEQMTAAITPY